MFYDVYCDLCRKSGLTPSGAASRIGFNRAARFVEQMEKDGILGQADGTKPRTVNR